MRKPARLSEPSDAPELGPRDWPCKPAFREQLLTDFPALQHSQFYRNVVGHVLFANELDRETGKPVLSAPTVLMLAGKKPNDGNQSAMSLIETFERDVFPLRPSGYSYRDQRARTVDPVYPPGLDNAAIHQAYANLDGQEDMVYLTNGEPVTEKTRSRVRADYRTWVERAAVTCPRSHPAYDFIQILHGGKQKILQHLVDANMPAMLEYLHSMPTGMKAQEARYKYALRELNKIKECGAFQRYEPTPRTYRIYSPGVTVNRLPRELRTIALRGTVGMDLAAAQLAVVARVYGLPKVEAFLAAGGSIWTELLRYLDLGPEWKPLLKKTLYSVCFGMSACNYMKVLAFGSDKKGRSVTGLDEPEGIGLEEATRFVAHPLIAELLEGRAAATERVKQERGMRDAFGHFQHFGWPHQILARVAQSFEFRIMAAAVPVLQSERGIEVVSFLHDGMYVYFGRSGDATRQCRRVQAAVSEEARRLGVLTALEIARIRSPGTDPGPSSP